MSSIIENRDNADFTASKFITKDFGKYRNKTPEYLWSMITWPVKTLGMHLLRDKIYYAYSNSFKRRLDTRRVQESKEILKAIGGESLTLETEDGVKIDAMFFDVDNFRKKIEGYGGAFITKNQNQSYLEFSSFNLKNLMKKMRVDLEESSTGYFVNLGRSQKNLNLNQAPNVMILTQGNACIYEFNRADISRFLLKGQNVIAFNIRGTGDSSGIPSEEGTYSDIEVVYQYLKNVRGFKSKEINVYGYCLGSGPATELAFRHPGVNLYIDRAAAKISDIMTNIVELLSLGSEGIDENKIKQLSRLLLRLTISNFLSKTIISYNNEKKVLKIYGKIFALHGENDDVIPHWSSDILQQAVRDAQSSTADPIAVMADIEHCEPLPEITEEVLNEHMEQNGTSNMRDFPNTITSRDFADILRNLALSTLGEPSAYSTPTHIDVRDGRSIMEEI